MEQSFFHMDLRTKSRPKNNENHRTTAVASAAYRHCAEMVLNEQKYNFKNKAHQLKYENILMPKNSDGFFDELGDISHLPHREQILKKSELLWQKGEEAEKRIDARLYKELIISLPRNIDLNASKNALERFLNEHVVSLGIACDLAIHSDLDGLNPHAHVMMTQRRIENGEFSLKKERAWDKKDVLLKWREQWCEIINEYLEQRDQPTCSHLSYVKQAEMAMQDNQPELAQIFMLADSNKKHAPRWEYQQKKHKITEERASNKRALQEKLKEFYEATRVKITSATAMQSIFNSFNNAIRNVRNVYDKFYYNDNGRLQNRTSEDYEQPQSNVELSTKLQDVKRTLSEQYQRSEECNKSTRDEIADKINEALNKKIDRKLDRMRWSKRL